MGANVVDFEMASERHRFVRIRNPFPVVAAERQIGECRCVSTRIPAFVQQSERFARVKVVIETRLPKAHGLEGARSKCAWRSTPPGGSECRPGIVAILRNRSATEGGTRSSLRRASTAARDTGGSQVCGTGTEATCDDCKRAHFHPPSPAHPMTVRRAPDTIEWRLRLRFPGATGGRFLEQDSA